MDVTILIKLLFAALLLAAFVDLFVGVARALVARVPR
jgi:hypothetical protein